MMPLVSVIIPSYNHERFIVEAIRSVIQQTYARIELIVIDDHSQDSSYYVAKGLVEEAASRGRFEGSYVNKHSVNAGAHATINEGIEESTGNLITILNSDDFFAPSRLEKVVDGMLRLGSEFGFSLTTPVNAFSQPIDQTHLPGSLTDAFDYILWARNVFPTISFAFLSRNVAISTGNMIFSRTLYDKLNGFRNYKYIHDWDFILRGCLITEPCFVDEKLYFYRLHSSNSFSSLASIGDIEINQMTRDIFSLFNGQVINCEAPIPRLWPGIFEAFEDELYLVKRAKSLGITF